MGHQVALFITCLTDQFYPKVGVAVTKILQHLGCEVVFPAAQTCCGQPFYNNGFHDDARDLAKRMIEIFEHYPYVVTPSGSCAAMIREHFPDLLEHDHAWEHPMRLLVDRTYEFVEFLDQVLKVDLSAWKLPESERLTFHYSCHLRGIGLKNEPIQLLKQIKNVDYVPLEKMDQCCGFGGTFALKYPQISGALVEDKVACVEATGARTLIVNDAGCAMNISGMCHRRGNDVRLKHFAELLAQAMGLSTDQW